MLFWGAWFGSLIGIGTAVWALMMLFPRDPTRPDSSNAYYFGITASSIFTLFEKVQLIIAGAALIFAFIWQLYRGATRLKIALFMLFALATVASVVETAHIAPRINQLRSEGETNSTEFKKMHGLSMSIYGGNLALMLAGGILLSIAITKETRERT